MIDNLQLEKMTFGKRIRTYRQMQGLSQAKLGELCQLAQSEITQLERDCVPWVSAVRIARVAKALGVTTSHLLGEVPFLCEWPQSGE